MLVTRQILPPALHEQFTNPRVQTEHRCRNQVWRAAVVDEIVTCQAVVLCGGFERRLLPSGFV